MYSWLVLAIALPSVARTALEGESSGKELVEMDRILAEPRKRYAGGYYYHLPQYYYQPQRGVYRPYNYGRAQPYYRQQPFRGYYPQPNNLPQQFHHCPRESKERVVMALESTMNTVEHARQGLELVLMRLRRRPSLFEFPRTLLQTARAATSLLRDLHEVMSSVSGPCSMQSQATYESTADNNNDNDDEDMKVRFVNSLMDMKKSAKSLESAVAQLFESPFKAFTNIGEVFTDLKTSLSSALDAVVGENASDGDDDSSNSSAQGESGSSTDSGFADFTSFSPSDSTTSDAKATDDSSAATSTDGFGDFGSFASSTSTSLPATADETAPASSLSTGNSNGLTRRFTFTAEEMLTFTNREILTIGQKTVAKEFDFTTVEFYRFTDTTVFVEDLIAVATTGTPVGHLSAAITPAPRRH